MIQNSHANGKHETPAIKRILASGARSKETCDGDMRKIKCIVDDLKQKLRGGIMQTMPERLDVADKLLSRTRESIDLRAERASLQQVCIPYIPQLFAPIFCQNFSCSATYVTFHSSWIIKQPDPAPPLYE